MMKLKTLLLSLGFLFSANAIMAQDAKPGADSIRILEPDYQSPKKYTLAGVYIEGIKYVEQNYVYAATGFYRGQKITIPGDEIPQCIENLWKMKYFTDIKVYLDKVINDSAYLIIRVEERPRLLKFGFKGLKKKDAKNLKEELTLKAGDIVTENLINYNKNEIIKFFREKGYYNTRVMIEEEPDTARKNYTTLHFTVDKGQKIKVNEVIINGNEVVSDRKLRKLLRDTKGKKHKINPFKSSKFIEEKYQEEKRNIITKYNTLGYKDARIVTDSIYPFGDNRVNIEITVSEGRKYYFRNISFIGNSLQRTSRLDSVLNIKKGDIYNQSKLESRLYMSPDGYDISSLYMDDGYLFFNVTPVEVLIENDSIDLEIRISEGLQATINNVYVQGNTKTSDHVILRELRTKPGQKFSRSDIQRSMRELIALGYFDGESMDVNPVPNATTGTVDITYKVVEKPSDQVELSGGWGGVGGVVGTLGLVLNNFSAKKMLKPKQWNPIPSGDGQRLTIRAQSNGLYYQSYNASFTEPWLGGKKPTALTVSIYHSIQVFNGVRRKEPNSANIATTGATLALGQRLKKPDDYFTTQLSLNYQRYLLHNAANWFLFNEGTSHNLNLRFVLSRNSIDHPIFPTSGSQISLQIQATPPWSTIMGRNFSGASDQEKYRLVEMHKYKFDAAFYTNVFKDLVLTAQTRFGLLGYYNKTIGASPFERFVVGGSGLTGFNLYGSDVISQRGYEDRSISGSVGLPIYNKYTIELRYPLSKNPNAMIYLLTFAEAGNAWNHFKQFNPFEVRRAAGGGVRIFLPMFGLLGVDYGYGFDTEKVFPGVINPQKGQFHFFIGQQF